MIDADEHSFSIFVCVLLWIVNDEQAKIFQVRHECNFVIRNKLIVLIMAPTCSLTFSNSL